MDNLTLSPEDHTDGVLSLRQAKGPQFPQEHIDDLALKYDSAMGSTSPGAISIASSLETNNQDRLAELVNMQKGVDLENTRNTIIQQIANQSGGVPTQQDIAAVHALSTQALSSGNVNSALEDAYAKQVTNTQLDAVNKSTNGAYDDAITSNPGVTNEILDRAEFQTSRNMISNNILVDLKKKFDNSDIFTKGQAWAQTFVPFRSWAAMDNFLGQKVLSTSVLPGNSVEQQVAWLHTLAPSEYKQKLQEGVDRLVSQGDYLDAMNFVQATLAYGDNDKNWANIYAGLDVASVIPGGTILKALKGSSKVVNVALKEAEATAKVAGFEGDAVKVAMTESLIEKKLPLNNIKKGEDVERAVMSISRPAEVFSGQPTKASGAVLGRLQVAAQQRASTALVILADTNKIDRLTPGEVSTVVAKTMDDMKKSFVDQSSNLINLRHNEADNFSNIHTVTAEFGKKDGSWFPDEKGAKAWAVRILGDKTTDYTLANKGTGWAVEVSRNVDESKAGIRDFSIETDSKNADNFLTRFVPFLMGADTKLSKSQQIARSAVVMTTERQNDLLHVFGPPIAELQGDKKGFKEWEKFLKTSRDRVDPERGRGVTYHTLGEFEDAWYAQYSKLPTEAQSDAYLAYKQAYDLETQVRALDVYKQKAILGIEKFSAKRLVDEKMSEPLEFEGKIVSSLPYGNKQPFRIALLDEEGTLKSGLKSDSRYMTPDDITALNKELGDGYTIVQAYDGVVSLGDKRFNFVAMKNFKRDRVDMNIGYLNSPRVIQKYPYYIKQARLNISGGKAYYMGDESIANARDAADGKVILDKMENARKALKTQMAEGNKFRKDYPAKKYFEENFPMWDYADFTKAVQEGRINLDTPFTLTRSGARTIDHNLKDALVKEGHAVDEIYTNDEYRLSNQVRGRFLGEPSETNMKTWGVEKDSIFELATDSTLSPLETLKLSMGDMVDVNVMNDYKIKSIRDFTQQFGHILEGDASDFQTNGLKYIYNPLYRKGASDAEKKGAEAVRKAILNLWQHSTSVDRAVNTYKEKLITSLRGKVGDNIAEWVGDKALPKITNADAFMRSFAFHTKMGFFNPKQLFLQASSAVQIVSISPKYGSKAAMLTSPIIAGLKAGSDDLLKGVGVKLAGTMGIKPDDYVELVKMYRRSGFDLVGGDVAWVDDLSPPNFIKGKVGQVLDLGTTPFRVGERIARTMAFSTAYLEKKAAGKALTRADEAWILKRAKDLTGNMTRDSNAPYQQGYTAIASQFFGYQMRLMEQMLGNKLTLAEKGRLAFGMSLAYGVPVGAGMTVGVIPVRDYFKKWMTENNIQTDNTVFEPFVDGFASQLLKLITGTDYDVAGRYGPNGLTNFNDALTGDVSLFSFLTGASGGIIFNTLADADPIIKGVMSAMNPNEIQKFPIVLQDLLGPLSEISTANSFIKLWKAANLSAWVSKNENKLTDISQTEAMIGAVLGLDPQRVADAFSQIDVMNQYKDEQSKEEKQMIADGRRAIQAQRAGDINLAMTYWNRVKMRGHMVGFTPKQFTRMYHQILQNDPLDEAVMKQFSQMFKE